jgi:dihydroorotate dehydrogenase
MLKLFLSIPLVSSLIKLTFKKNNILLEKEVFGLKFPNPVGLAAGFDKNAKYIKELSSLGFGFIEIGTVTPKAQPGNPKKRVFRLIDDNALINRLGINNDGCEVCSERLKNNKENIIIGGNIGKNTNTDNENAIEDYVINFNTLHSYVDYFVLNVSCPNVSNFTKLQDVEFLKNLLPKLKKINENKNKPKPILIKISPDLSTKQLDETIDLIISENLDGIIATNTSTNRENLKTTENELKEIGNGGLSGNPIKNRSNEVISYISKKTNKKLPIIGVGGIMSAQDAVDKLNAGADLVQIYTGFIYAGPSIIKQINELIIKNYTKS